ncbi:MAG: hypothetical protein WCG81_08460 [Candidatus Angelobacter sp.]
MKNLFSFVTGFLLVFFAGTLVFLAFYARDAYKDRQQRVLISGETPLFAPSDEGRKLCFNKGRIKIATVSAGEQIKVRRIIYEKDCMTVRIRTRFGQEGYLVSGAGAWRIQ